MSNVGLRGCVDYFDGKTIGGWVLDTAQIKTPISVDIYINGILATTLLADRHRVDLSEINLFPALPKISVKFHKTDKELDVTDNLLGSVNNEDSVLKWFLKSAARNRFLPVPPIEMIRHVGSVSDENFREVGMLVASDLIQFGLLANPNAIIVDIGCGCGRVAMFIAPTLSDKGSYQGFDTWTEGIRWATENITTHYPNVVFKTLVPGEEESGYRADTFRGLDIDDNSCDLVVATSLFTHLRYDTVLSYMKEIYRITKKGARAYLTFFIYDEESVRAITHKDLEADKYGFYYVHGNYAVSYFKEGEILDIIHRSHLLLHIKKLGFWRGEKYNEERWPAGYQDLFILRKE
jgi:SAM-dependent methyltransferase